jgi:3alpha(or 20beta)-hydroxysteroid dehydrogenase
VNVNNAGIAQIKPVEETTLDDWHRVVDVNLTSVFLSARYLFPLMRDGGAVVNVPPSLRCSGNPPPRRT